MIEAFNSMAAELASSRRRLERAAIDLERKHQEVEGRRRYIETILERIATGVVSIDPAGRIGTINSAAVRLLDVDADGDRPAGRGRVRARGSAADQRRARSGGAGQDRRGRAGGRARARRARAARRGGGHAPDRRRRRLRRHGARARRRDAAHPRAEGGGVARSRAAAGARDQEPADADSAVGRADAAQARRSLDPPLARPRAGVHDDDHRRGRSRSRTWSTSSRSLRGCRRRARSPPICTSSLDDALALYNGLFADVRFERRFGDDAAAGARRPRADAPRRHQPDRQRDRGHGSAAARSSLETSHDPSQQLVRVIVADDGPGIPAGEREKLFLPYYSTKGRGSGLGLAIVRRIVAEHGGTIDVADNVAARHAVHDRVAA